MGYSKATFHCYGRLLHQLILFYQDFYDTREEYDKDRWDIRRIPGATINHNVQPHTWIDFTRLPEVFRPLVKRYARTLIAQGLAPSSIQTQVLSVTRFLQFILDRHYEWVDLGNLHREDMEAFYEVLRREGSARKERWYISRLIFVRKFLEHIQIRSYDEAPQVPTSHLIFFEDIPYRLEPVDEVIRYIPEAVLTQLDRHVDELDRPQYIPIVVLLRATGWRIADILNLRYDTCLVKSPEGWYIQGDITKTRVLNHRVPINHTVAGMLATLAEHIKSQSTAENNPDRFLFVYFRGQRRGLPFKAELVQRSMDRLAATVPILDDEDGSVFHFRNHAFRHSKAVELINNGMRLDLVQKWLAHASPKMTQVYARLLDTTMR